MALLSQVVYDGGLQRPLSQGDLLINFEPLPPATDTTVTLAYAANSILNSPVYVRNPASASTDTFPTADALISAVSQGLGLNLGTRPGVSFRWRVINLSANLLTGAVTANTGVTMVRGNVPASTTKEFLISITNGTPLLSAVNLSFTNGSNVVGGLTTDQISRLTPGMVVTNSVGGLQGQTILAVNATNNTVVMSGNASSTSTGTFTFSPTYTITGLAA